MAIGLAYSSLMATEIKAQALAPLPLVLKDTCEGEGGCGLPNGFIVQKNLTVFNTYGSHAEKTGFEFKKGTRLIARSSVLLVLKRGVYIAQGSERVNGNPVKKGTKLLLEWYAGEGYWSGLMNQRLVDMELGEISDHPVREQWFHVEDITGKKGWIKAIDENLEYVQSNNESAGCPFKKNFLTMKPPFCPNYN